MITCVCVCAVNMFTGQKLYYIYICFYYMSFNSLLTGWVDFGVVGQAKEEDNFVYVLMLYIVSDVSHIYCIEMCRCMCMYV